MTATKETTARSTDARDDEAPAWARHVIGQIEQIARSVENLEASQRKLSKDFEDVQAAQRKLSKDFEDVRERLDDNEANSRRENRRVKELEDDVRSVRLSTQRQGARSYEDDRVDTTPFYIQQNGINGFRFEY